MLLSEDNYGRWEAAGCIWNWMAVGAALGYLLIDAHQVIVFGRPQQFGYVGTAAAMALLIWQLVSGFREFQGVREIRRRVNDRAVPLSLSLLLCVVAVGVVLGALTIAVCRYVLLPSADELPWILSPALVRIAGIIGACALLGMIGMLLAWFVVFPRAESQS